MIKKNYENFFTVMKMKKKERLSLTNIIMIKKSQIQEKYYEYMNVWKEEILFFEWFDWIKNSNLLPLNKVLKTWMTPKGNFIYSTHPAFKKIKNQWWS